LGERLDGIQKVAGSSPAGSTELGSAAAVYLTVEAAF
jgi:hypothetical protein